MKSSLLRRDASYVELPAPLVTTQNRYCALPSIENSGVVLVGARRDEIALFAFSAEKDRKRTTKESRMPKIFAFVLLIENAVYDFSERTVANVRAAARAIPNFLRSIMLEVGV